MRSVGKMTVAVDEDINPNNVEEVLWAIAYRTDLMKSVKIVDHQANGHAPKLRDREWEAAHTVWLWADPSASMLYQSKAATVSKESRALVLSLALAELLSRSGERIAWPGLTDPFSARNGAERLAAQMLHAAHLPTRPDLSSTKRFSDVVLISDFLDPVDETREWLDTLATRGVRAHLIEIADPAEEEFPYSGRTEFQDPETGTKLTAGRAETLRDDYRNLYTARRDELSAWARKLGWSYTVNHPDRLASDALVRVHLAMSQGSR